MEFPAFMLYKSMKLFPIVLFTVLSFCVRAQQDTLQQKVFTFVEQMPEYIGGEKAMLAFIHKNLHYPKTENNDLATGRVFVRFIVNEDGSVSDATIMRSVNEALDKEVLRVVSALPNFKPGRHQGKAVKVYYTLPVLLEYK